VNKEELSKERLLLFTLAAIQFTHIVDFVIVMPLGPSLMRYFAIEPSEFGWIVSSYTFSAGVFGFLSVFLVDRFDRKAVLNTCYLGFIAGTIYCALADSYFTLVLARVIAGAFGGVLGASILAIAGDLVPFERRGRASGIIMSAFALASVAGVPLGLYLAGLFDWKMPFYALSGFSALVLVFAHFTLPPVRKHLEYNQKKNPFRKFGDLLLEKGAFPSFFLIISLMFAGFSVIPFISPYLVSNVKISESDLAYIYLVGGGTTLFSGNIIGKLADKFGKKEVFSIVAFLSLIPIFLITNLPELPLVMVLGASTLFFVLVSGRIIPAMALITSSISSEKRGSFMSLNSSVQQLASGLASYTASFILAKTDSGELIHYEKVGYLAMVAGVISIILAQRIPIQEEDNKK
jgi:predicted MFS family arabinose efflux permease